MKTIVAPVDFSDISGQVVAEAKKLARAVGGRIVLIHAVRPLSVITEYSPESERLIEEEDGLAQGTLESLRKEIVAEGVETEAIVRHDYPVAAILDEVYEAHADYIVMGSHGRTALHDLLVGDTAHGVLRKAPCPVLIVPSAKHAHATASAESAASA